jgi:hypothetical protein
MLALNRILFAVKGCSMYTTTFTELVQMLKKTRQNWVVNIETEETGSGKPWQAQLSMVDGIVTVCQVWHKADGRSLFSDGGAIRWLTSLPSLTWTPEPMTPQQALPQAVNGSQMVASSPSPVPRRFRQVEQRAILSLSRKQRQVFALVDGTRSIEKIAVILRQPVEVVTKALYELETMGVITLE